MEAALLDGAGSFKFALDILMPLSISRAAAIFIIAFMIGWNQYLWPLLMTTDPDMKTIVIAIDAMIPTGDDYGHWPTIMATAILAMLPPVIVVISMQKFFVKGLLESDK